MANTLNDAIKWIKCIQIMWQMHLGSMDNAFRSFRLLLHVAKCFSTNLRFSREQAGTLLKMLNFVAISAFRIRTTGSHVIVIIWQTLAKCHWSQAKLINVPCQPFAIQNTIPQSLKGKCSQSAEMPIGYRGLSDTPFLYRYLYILYKGEGRKINRSPPQNMGIRHRKQA